MLLFFVALLLCPFSFADVVEAPSVIIDFQQNPSTLKWRKIDTEHFEIIFPKEIEAEAQRVSHLLETAYPLVTRSLEVLPKKISLVLQNQSTDSNGFVTLAPRRSEWYVTPAIDPELTNTEWLKTLAVHEFRHVVQFQKSRRGFNEFYNIILGEIGQALGIGFTMPPWFLEGDAVGVETALTKGGRGRLPLFERNLRALLLSGRKYNYDQAHLGSYKNYIPNHYVWGYFYTSYMRNQRGDLFSSKLINKSADRAYNPLSFYNAYDSLTGDEFEDFYRDTIQDLIKNWKEKEAKLSLTPYEVKNIPMTEDWTNYYFPQSLGNNKYFALKRGLSYINQFVVTDGKEEKTFLYPGRLLNEYPYKVRNGRFAWIEAQVDPRWGYRDFSEVKVYDFKKEKIITELKKTKARLAVLDHKGESILFVNWDVAQGQQLVVTDLDGKVLKEIEYPREQVITSLDWLTETEIVMVVKNRDDQKQVLKYSLSDGTQEVLIAQTTDNLGFITSSNGKILIESPQSGIDNIFEVTGGKLKQLTSSRFGAYAPEIAQDSLVYNDYTDHGMNIVAKKLPWDEEQKSGDSFVPVYEKLVSYEKPGAMDQNFSDKHQFPVTDYSQVQKAVNLHSWILLAPPLSSIVSVQGLSRDVLNKFALTAGANYDLNEHETEGFVGAAWSHYYPVFDLRAAYAGRNQTLVRKGVKANDHWEEGTLEAGMQVPWKKIAGRFSHDFNLRGFAKVIKVTKKDLALAKEVGDGALFSPGVEAQYSFVSKLATRDLNPEWGASLLTHYESGTDITGTGMQGSIFSADGRLFLPGLKKHHSFFHQLGYEKQRDRNYQYSSILLKPRGTANFFLEESRKYSANYMFPLFYPDWNLSSYAYLKRVSLNLFYDDLNAYYRSFNYHAASTGWEVLLDTNFVRIFVPFTIGLRGSYVLDGIEKAQNYEIFVTTLGGYF